MKLNCSIFDDTVVFDEETSFSKDFRSPTGALFTATTLPGEQVLTIIPMRKGSGTSEEAPAAVEHVVRLLIGEKLWNVEMNPSGDVTFISIGGEKPKGIINLPQQAISGGGPRPVDPGNTSKIELKGNHGSWRIEPDLSGQFLDLSFKSI
jgi:hypothetical protein